MTSRADRSSSTVPAPRTHPPVWTSSSAASSPIAGSARGGVSVLPTAVTLPATSAAPTARRSLGAACGSRTTAITPLAKAASIMGERRLHTVALERHQRSRRSLEEPRQVGQGRAPQDFVGERAGGQSLQPVSWHGTGSAIGVHRLPVSGDEREIGLNHRIRHPTPPAFSLCTGLLTDRAEVAQVRRAGEG